MKEAVYLILIYLGNIICINAQNLIPDSGFENVKYISCDFSDFLQDFMVHWSQPLPTSTDYWHSDMYNIENCNRQYMQIPFEARSGKGMVAIVTYTYVADNIYDNYREYFQTKLTSPLKKNKLYLVDFYYRTDNEDDWVTNNLGFYFSREMVKKLESDDPYLNYQPQFIIDTLLQKVNGWTKLSGCFIADDSFEYVTIGNFSPDSLNKIQGTDRKYRESFAYYYFDDISIQELEYHLEQIPSQYEFCHNELFLNIKLEIPGATKLVWSTGDEGSEMHFTERKDSKEYVDIYFDECIYRHFFYIDYKENIDIGSDTTLCFGDNYLLKAEHSIQKFIWSNGSNEPEINIHQPGKYSIIIQDKCFISDTIIIDYINCPGFIPNIITPNSDGNNDRFIVENIESRKWSIKIFNRWGKLVYTNDHYRNEWAGNGLKPGIYYYFLKSDDLNKNVNGWIQILK